MINLHHRRDRSHLVHRRRGHGLHDHGAAPSSRCATSTSTIQRGEFVTLIGHSGCGKSTLLNLVAGLTTPTSGLLLLDERELHGPGPDRGVVFQNHSLLPWLSCYDNVHLAVERVFGEDESKAQLRERCWPRSNWSA